MRVNVYNEELTNEVEVVLATPETGKSFVGIRFMLESADTLHHEEGDDDRSAVTIWCDTPSKARNLLHNALRALDTAHSTTKP